MNDAAEKEMVGEIAIEEVKNNVQAKYSIP